jgi:hypothetical protein
MECPPMEVDLVVTQRLNSLLPQVTGEIMDVLFKEVLDAPDPDQLRKIFEERLELFQRENFTLYSRLNQFTTPEQMGWIVYVYCALAAQSQKDMRWPS